MLYHKRKRRDWYRKILNPRLTKKNTEVVKIILDNDEEIICTPDHKFMLRDGSFLEAENLARGTSLMPLNKKLSQLGGRITIEGYEMVLNPKTHKWVFTHMLSDEHNLDKGAYSRQQGTHKHHKDFNKLNNDPGNLMRLSKEGHLGLHRACACKTLQRRDVVEKCNRIKRSPEYRARLSQKIKQFYGNFLSEKAKKQWRDPAYKSHMTQKFLEFYQGNVDYQKKNAQILNLAQEKYWSKKRIGQNRPIG